MKASLRFSLPVLIALIGASAFAQNDTVSPNENLVAEGVPSIPASLATSVERYSNFRGAVWQAGTRSGARC